MEKQLTKFYYKGQKISK